MTKMNSEIVSFCTIFKCLGFSVKSLGTCEKESATRNNASKGITIGFSCHKSGLRIEMGLDSVICSCPSVEEADSSGVWQVSGTSGGISVSKDSGSTVLQHLSRNTTDYVKKRFDNILEVVNLQANIKENCTSTPMKQRRYSMGKEVSDDIYARCQNNEFNISNVSASLSSLNVTPPKAYNISRVETPSRYRSLDTLANLKPFDDIIPKTGTFSAREHYKSDINIAKRLNNISKNQMENVRNEKVVIRQNTYTEPEDILHCAKKQSSPSLKSDPVQYRMTKVENLAKDLLHLVHDVNEILGNRRLPDPDTSGVSIPSDVSKISSMKPPNRGINGQLLAVPSSRLASTFGSIPNLASPSKRADETRTNLQRESSVSTPKLPRMTLEVNANKKDSAARKPRNSCGPGLSTPTFGKRKESVGSAGSIPGSYKSLSDRSSTTGIVPPKPISFNTSPRTSPACNVSDPQLKKKSNLYSHVKSTIPRATTKKGG